MNRKDRRAQEKASEKKQSKHTIQINIDDHNGTSPADLKAEGLKAQATAMKNAGKDRESIPLFIESLKFNSGLADVHFQLAMMSRLKPELNIDLAEVNKNVKNKNKLKEAYQVILSILRERKQYSEAIVCQEELCRLFPADLDEKANLGILLNLTGRTEDALRIFAELSSIDPKNPDYKTLFVRCNGPITLTKHEPLIKNVLQGFFDNIYETNLAYAFHMWIELVWNDPECKGLIEARQFTDWIDFSKWMDQTNQGNAPFFNEKFFLDGIRLLIIPSIALEKLLVSIRKWVCLNINKIESENKIKFFEPFILALAEQTFFNEYIYAISDDEIETIKNLASYLSENGIKDESDRFKLALIGCYQSVIFTFPNEENQFHEISKKFPEYKNFLKTQFFDPYEEQKIKPSLETFDQLENVVSKNVQAQYEENPYPRWISIGNSASAVSNSPIHYDDRDKPLKILIAGCGTGRHALGTAANYPNAEVIAIDLSKASLAYAQRKANESDLSKRVRFIHADILSMEKWQGEFDIIESSGVLHHMQDPFKGWKILTRLLKENGFFKIGLYSELARTQVVEARNYVQKNGFPATLDGIRKCRESILQLPSNDLMRIRLESTSDFYTTSLIRDLIFHVQEHRMTLPQIEGMMKKLNLKCHHFVFGNADILRRYDLQFPNDLKRNDMKNWHEFELLNPDAFIGMYQFWCQKSTNYE